MQLKEEKLLILISRVRNIIFRELEKVFRKNGLTMTQFAILEVLLHKGPKCVGEIQELILGTNGNVPLVIKNLERDGKIKRVKDEKDGRISIIHLTKSGEECINKVYLEEQKKLKKILKDVSIEKIDKITTDLFDIYEKIRRRD